ncbi:DUF4312 family protein [Erwinia tracheiphila]|uniref:Cytoplasmic protein n=1 Tax=Erwinia tracheiphila TaxID=65700 RepID=A0A0M2KA22_9GAMM|nr:DUF4312 family protein [Erwinia tracheiphila]AXF77376.1 DUF4312 family protein [Erwinia tracheiphila]EOS95068.1 hypothetical protein ETR_10092 [Erwinia tracheiphila PSU-1]KKF36250.1 cytoplasmic protein [Erwinia tracheiphila]UIA83935.1 DUF4312 family protein [Erwinia tracheiphila]UIA87573.1 DUF4312 family protein [Erwinia tracheiphila]
MKEQFTTTVTVSGKGDSKARAFADALSRVQNTLLKSTNKVLLRIEPQEVKVVQARESARKEKFLFFFLARERRSYSIELEITVNVSVIDVDKVDFIT